MKFAACSALVLLAGVAQAQDQPPPADVPAVSDEFVSLFTAYCLQKFPDDAALAERAARDKHVALSPGQVSSFLHSDPGMGWLIAGQDSKYVLTIEQPPFHACAVRRYSDRPLNGAPLIAAAQRFAAIMGRKLAPPRIRERPIGNDIVSSAMQFEMLDDKDQPVNEAFMFFVVRYPATTKPDGTQGVPFFEVRFVRQIHRQQV